MACRRGHDFFEADALPEAFDELLLEAFANVGQPDSVLTQRNRPVT